MSDHGGDLPRLLYVGDVAVADTHAGEALLFRLLQFYPPERLTIICAVRPGMPALPGVTYHHWGARMQRLLWSRVAEEYVLWHAWRYYQVPAKIAAIAAAFRPDAVLTISHVSGWLCGWQLAVKHAIPLHLIAHDDLVYCDRFPSWSRGWATARFREAYRAAASRFCVSDTMAELYEQQFGAPAQVLYPASSPAAGRVGVRPHVGAAKSPLTFGYGGSINSAAQMLQVADFARQVTAHGHRLLVYTPQHGALSKTLATDGVSVHAPVSASELREILCDRADCLFLPQSMAEDERSAVATAFPSKWADYATMGLPVLVWAPSWSSSARFVNDHSGCAELVTSPEPEALGPALARLQSAPLRVALAERLIEVGRRSFSAEAGWQLFRDAIMAAKRA